MGFDAGDVSALLTAMHGLGDDQGTALAARLKHLNRLGFPRAEGPGRGARLRYDLEDVLKFAMLFQLLDGGAPSVRAVELLGARWGEVRAALVSARRYQRREGPRPVLVVVEPHALAALGRIGHAQQRKVERLELTGAGLRSERAPGAAVRLMVDPTQVMRALIAGLAGTGMARESELDAHLGL